MLSNNNEFSDSNNNNVQSTNKVVRSVQYVQIYVLNLN